MPNQIRPEVAHAINGVPGRLFALNIPPAPWVAGVFASQKWVSEFRPVKGYGTKGEMQVKIRFDDECRNGHNTFSITADVYTAESRRMRDIAAGGCRHDEIAAVFPELAPLIKWHLVNTGSPMHYVANALYHASDADHGGKRAGEPCAFAYGVRFGNSPMTHILKTAFYNWIKAAEEFNSSALKTNPAYVHFEPVAVAHKKEPGSYDFADKYTFAGYDTKWYECPFDNLREAEEFRDALKLPHELVKVATDWSRGKARNLDAARRAACWPEATDAQLCAPHDELKLALEARLPGLIAELRAAMEGAGFIWAAPSREGK